MSKDENRPNKKQWWENSWKYTRIERTNLDKPHHIIKFIIFQIWKLNFKKEMKDLSSSRKNYRICLGINAIKSEIFASLGTISREYYQIKMKFIYK